MDHRRGSELTNGNRFTSEIDIGARHIQQETRIALRLNSLPLSVRLVGKAEGSPLVWLLVPGSTSVVEELLDIFGESLEKHLAPSIAELITRTVKYERLKSNFCERPELDN